MHPNARLLHKLFTSLNEHDDVSMIECYHPDATFRDIAFDLSGREEIYDMWAMICQGRSELRATFDVVHADDLNGFVRVVDDYTFYPSEDSPSSAGRPVHNIIDSHFVFRDGLIIEHRDECDARTWARSAVGGISGFLAGRFRFLRKWKVGRKLQAFREKRYGQRREPSAAAL